MGKRVWIKLTPLVLAGSVDPKTGMAEARHLHGRETARLSCGHGSVRPVSFFASSGDPIWCDECESECLACGAPSTDCRNPSWEWGESCEACFVLSDRDWCRAVRDRRYAQREKIQYGLCPACSEPMTGNTGIVLLDDIEPEDGGRVAHYGCVKMRKDFDALKKRLGPLRKAS